MASANVFAQDVRINFLSSLLGLDSTSELDRKRALRNLNQQPGCLHAFYCAGGILELYVFAEDSATVFDGAFAWLRKDLDTLAASLTTGSESYNPFFKTLRDEVPPLLIVGADEEYSDRSQNEQHLRALHLRILVPEGAKELSPALLERTLADLRRRLKAWKDGVGAELDVDVKATELKKGAIKPLDDRLALSLREEPLTMSTEKGEMLIGFCSLNEIYQHHRMLGEIYGVEPNQVMVSSNIRTYLGGNTHTNSSLIEAFQDMERNKNPLDDFPFLHNGMTLTGDSVKIRKNRQGGCEVLIDRPKIINGAQSLFTYEEYVTKSKNPVNPQVLVKVIVPSTASSGFLVRVTMANNRQNPVFSYHLRAADDAQFHIFQAMQALEVSYVYKSGMRGSKSKTRKLELRMRPDLARTLFLLDGKIGDARSPDLLFDREALYQQYFGYLSKHLEESVLKKIVVFAKAYQILSGMRLKNKESRKGRLEMVPNEEHPLNRITWQGRTEDKFAFRSAARDLIICLVLRYYLVYGDPLSDFERLAINMYDFQESILRYASRVCAGEIKTVMIEHCKDEPCFYDIIVLEDSESGEVQERRQYRGLNSNKVFQTMLNHLQRADQAWKGCSGSWWDVLRKS